jgi:hypothetical protein
MTEPTEIQPSDLPIFQIEGARITSLDAFYEEVSRVVIPGADWGHNLNAFNDILRGGFGTPEGGFVLVWRDHHLSLEALGYPETVRQLDDAWNAATQTIARTSPKISRPRAVGPAPPYSIGSLKSLLCTVSGARRRKTMFCSNSAEKGACV